MNNWISIHKQWPKRYQYVLVHLVSRELDIMCIDIKDVNNQMVATWWDKLGLNEKDFGLVTHWMLLPRKPNIKKISL